jgi:hypothetical protein
MSENLWDEIEGILEDKEHQIYRAPFWIDLTPNGKTLIIIYPGRHQEEIAEAFIDKLGEPEAAGPLEEVPGNLFLLFPHQMTTATLLSYLEGPHIRTYNLDKVAVMDRELEGLTDITIDTLKPILPGNLVLGIKDGKSAAWRYSEGDNRSGVVGRITSVGRWYKH